MAKRTTSITDSDELTPQQISFCHEYIKDLNGKKAAVRSGYTDKSAQTTASHLLSISKVCDKIKQLNDEKLALAKIDANTILLELLKLAKSDVRKLFNENGVMINVRDLDDDIAPTIASIEIDELWEHNGKERAIVGQTKKIKFWDKTRALEMLGRHLSLFIDKVEHSGTVTLEDLVTDSFKKPEEKCE